jgi:carboxypeptidase family protein/TonB-dependent receptor-like protein
MNVRVRQCLWWVGCLGMTCGASAFACAAPDSQPGTAVLEGRVTDASGGVIPNAPVALRDSQMNVTRTAVTDRDGAYRLREIPVGEYDVRVDYGGFAPYLRAGLTLTIGQTARLNITLQPAGIVESVAVTAQTPPLDAGQTSLATTIDVERIEELPVRSRNYLEFVLLAPGVTRAPSRAQARSAPSSNLPDSGFSFGGLRPRSNSLTIDGLENNDEFTGSSRTELSLEIVREFLVVSNGWSAENGGASGGAINVVTKSGANVRHGDVFLFAQSGLLNARPKLENADGPKPSLRRFRGGVAFGGPIIKDRTFSYAAVEHEYSRGQRAAGIDAAAARSIDAALGAGLFPDVPTRRLTEGLFPEGRTETEWSAKLTHQAAGGSLIGRVAGTETYDDRNGFNAGALSDVSARGATTTRDVAFTTSWTTTVGARVVNDLRGQVATRRLDLRAVAQGTGVTIAGVADFGAPYSGSSLHDQSYVELGDTIGYSRGAHFVKAGADVRHVTVRGTTSYGADSFYVFRTLGAFLAGRPDQVRGMSAANGIELGTTGVSGFVQDRWTPGHGLTIDAGARVDAAILPASLDMTSRQVTPRLGVAWSPAAKWVLRGGAGIFADRIVLAALERSWLTKERRLVERVVDEPSCPAPSIYTVRRGTWNPASRQVSVGAERQVTSNLTVAINYLAVQGRGLSRTVNVNLTPPTILTAANAASLGIAAPFPQQIGRPVFGPDRLNPSFDGVFELQPTASSMYHGLTMSMNRRLANEVEWSAAYTWSRANDSASEFDEQPQNPYALADEWARSRYDQRHRFVVSALFDLPIGEEEDRRAGQVPGAWARAFSHIAIAPILTMGSGLPANIVTGGDDTRTRAFPLTSRPLGLARNALRLPPFTTLDVRLLKFFAFRPHGKLDLVIEAFNVLNRTNVNQIDTVYGPLPTARPSLGRAIAAGASRQLQFSIDFEF